LKFLAMSRRVAGLTDAQVAAQAAAEALQAFRLMRDGVFEQLWFSPDWRGAVLVMHAGAREEAQAALDSLPMVRGRTIEFDLWQLDPFDHYQWLFATEHRAAL
jgi:muconolactone delta-isomerase